MIPIFPELRPFLEKAFEEAVEGEEYVVPMARQSTNLGTHARRIIKKASVSVWPKVFTNLRASIEKELIQQEPSYKVQAWIGHTDAVARGHYLKVNDEDYVRAAGKAAQNPAHSASVRRRQGPSQPTGSKENPVKAGTSKNPVPPRGVELPHSTTTHNQKSIEGGAESGAIVDNPKLGQVLQALTSLTDDEREMLAELLKKMR